MALPLMLAFGAHAVAASGRGQATPQVGKHKTLELVFTVASSPANPFDTYLLKLEVTDPAGERFSVEGFYDGDGKGGQTGRVWKARLCPCMIGTWRWRTIAGDAPDSGLSGLSGGEARAGSGEEMRVNRRNREWFNPLP